MFATANTLPGKKVQIQVKGILDMKNLIITKKYSATFPPDNFERFELARILHFLTMSFWFKNFRKFYDVEIPRVS